MSREEIADRIYNIEMTLENNLYPLDSQDDIRELQCLKIQMEILDLEKELEDNVDFVMETLADISSLKYELNKLQ